MVLKLLSNSILFISFRRLVLKSEFGKERGWEETEPLFLYFPQICSVSFIPC